jgi:hypothetical protein
MGLIAVVGSFVSFAARIECWSSYLTDAPFKVDLSLIKD